MELTKGEACYLKLSGYIPITDWSRSYVANFLSFFGLPGFKQCYSTTNAVFFLHGSLDGSDGGFADDQTVMSFFILVPFLY